jgi:hypothetical protein
MEIWKEIEGFPGYKVSNQGRIENKRGQIRVGTNDNGYCRPMLFLNGHGHSYYTHRLVAAAFLGPCPEGKPEVDHINNIRSDNRVENLKYVNRSENTLKKLKKAGCKSLYIGVTKNGNRWGASVRAEKRVHLGCFDTQEEAARARDKYCRDKGLLVVFNFTENPIV